MHDHQNAAHQDGISPKNADARRLQAYLGQRYGVRVVDLTRLDRGVFRADLADGRRWIVRVFAASRPVEQVEGDAAILRFLADHNFPAERCADERPVAVAGTWTILVTEYIEGAVAGERGLTARTAHALGDLLGRLVALPAEDGPAARAAGALHHYVPQGGGPRDELMAASSWLAAVEDRTPNELRGQYEALRERLTAAEDCHDLPTALIHPDPVPKNVLVTARNELVFIDWTGAGRGPRVASLAVLVYATALRRGGWSPSHVDAVAAGYSAHVRLEAAELDRLGAVMRLRPLVFACWRYHHALLAGRAPGGDEWWWPDDALTDAVTARARDASRA